MLLNCQALESVGQFDPRYFMYYEDLDLCWRLEQAGWELWCDSRAVIQHAMEDGARARQSQLWRWRMKASSSRYFYRKRHRRPWADGQWLLASMVEGYWLVRGGHGRAMAHLLQATWEEISNSGTPRMPSPLQP
jgi:GT2 family glycosyltransferase